MFANKVLKLTYRIYDGKVKNVECKVKWLKAIFVCTKLSTVSLSNSPAKEEKLKNEIETSRTPFHCTPNARNMIDSLAFEQMNVTDGWKCV